ncbi:unnamed protein product [Mytilus coruscus]|uniref:Uncharacterized protein n=1 Tax=Mytilus coruscus TaxID=42192 RepID=A0A6J8BU66_MYTCO|nr:unnamed protein product [Mytilus coruscus]
MVNSCASHSGLRGDAFHRFKWPFNYSFHMYQPKHPSDTYVATAKAQYRELGNRLSLEKKDIILVAPEPVKVTFIGKLTWKMFPLLHQEAKSAIVYVMKKIALVTDRSPIPSRALNCCSTTSRNDDGSKLKTRETLRSRVYSIIRDMSSPPRYALLT